MNRFLFSITSIFLSVILFTSCNLTNEETNTYLQRDTFNLKFLKEQIDSIYPALSNHDSLKIEAIISLFDNGTLACLHPDLVFHAYYLAFAGNKDTEMSDYKNFPNKLRNFYYRFKQLADKSTCETMQAYSAYIVGRNFNELDSNEKAMPILLQSVDRFHRLNESYGFSLAAKRVGLCYLYSYKDFVNASKYLKLALNDTFDLNNQNKCYLHLIQCYFYMQQFDSLNKYVDLHLNSSQIDSGFNRNFNQTHTLKISTDLSITKRWKVISDIYYDFYTKKVNNARLTITRDMHCWNLALYWTPIGLNQSFLLRISANSSLFQSAKLEFKKPPIF